MKKVFVTIAFTLIVMTAVAQIQMEYDGHAKFQRVIEVDSMPAAELYKAVERWVAKTYTNPARVVNAQVENEEIRGKGIEPNGLILSEFPSSKSDFIYSFTIEVKDNRVRYTIHSMRNLFNGIEAYIYKKDGTERTSGQATSVKQSATGIASLLILSLESSLKDKKVSDW